MIRTGGTFGFISGEFRKNLGSLSKQFAASADQRGARFEVFIRTSLHFSLKDFQCLRLTDCVATVGTAVRTPNQSMDLIASRFDA